ncbi:MAG: GIY-YIG nuclease family protein [Candidatus Omnitrophica bacterium]|jgi:predicted GIY-YIG superfamily endonuclease|nr:GIY-YIG nuclease family protein [Candidatus Omnitrophota bacterium]
MHIVYILISKKYPDRIYIGFTKDISRRVDEHNADKSSYSRKYGPWELVTYITFSQKKKASEFERYLKSGSGFAFLKKRFI